MQPLGVTPLALTGNVNLRLSERLTFEPETAYSNRAKCDEETAGPATDM